MTEDRRLNLQTRNQASAAVAPLEQCAYRVEHVTPPLGAAFDFSWDGARSYLAAHDMVLRDGEMSGDDLAPTHIQDMRGKLTFLPEGMRVRGWCDPTKRTNAFTALYFDTDWFLDQIGASERSRAARPMIYFENSHLERLMQRLAHVAQKGVHAPRIMADSLAFLVVTELLDLEAARGANSGLSKSQLEAAQHFIEANLGNDISLDDIAGAAGLSSFHFSRSFKHATGVSPHQYLLSARIRHAQDLLCASHLPLAEIGALVGFKTPSHFSRTFAQITGLPPRHYRAHTTHLARSATGDAPVVKLRSKRKR